MSVSPRTLSGAALPFLVAWIASGIAYDYHWARGTFLAIPDLVRGVFFVGGPLAALLVGGVVMIRRRERQKFASVDKLAVCLSVLGAVSYVGSLAFAFFQSSRVGSP